MHSTMTSRHSIPWGDVRIDDPFWSPRLETLVTTTLQSQWQQLYDSGRLAALGIWAGPEAPPAPHIFYDSDIAKWLEAVAYAQAWHSDAALQTKALAVIAGYEQIQDADGYCNQHAIDAPERRWRNLRDEHELYCAGHLMEAAVAWHEALGDDRLLRVMARCCEHLWRRFGPDGEPGYGGHPEIELALVRMAEACDEPRWRQLAQLMVDRRGQEPFFFAAEAERRGERSYPWWPSCQQSQRPVRAVESIEGHAVRALYLLAGMEDLRVADADLAAACDAWWANAVERRMYITGGFGSNHNGELFTHDFDLPNREAYAETCAAIAGAMVARRRLARRRDAGDGDVLERCLYNGMLAGLAIDGEHYFYANPLCVQPGIDQFHKGYLAADAGGIARPPWYGCSCCPPNIARTLAALGGYIASCDETGLDLHLFIGSHIEHGGWRLQIAGDYVWRGQVAITIAAAPDEAQALRLRLPLWRTQAAITCNGEAVAITQQDGYAVIRRRWRAGDRVACDFGIAPRRCHADPRINDNAGRVALQRGPLIYCLEACDQDRDLFSLRLPDGADLREAACDLLPGAVMLAADGLGMEAEALYAYDVPQVVPAALRFVPFALWCNRAPGAMQVWVPRG